jgi:hypothetical protein
MAVTSSGARSAERRESDVGQFDRVAKRSLAVALERRAGAGGLIS